MRLRLSAPVGILLVLALLSCSGNGQRGTPEHGSEAETSAAGAAVAVPDIPDPGIALPALPSPQQLAAQLATEQQTAARSSSYIPADLFRNGVSFDALLPSQRVVASGNELVFSPEFSGNASDFAGLAFAMYSFTIPDYSGNSELSLGWSTAAIGSGEDDYLALANWDSDRWDWFAPGPGGTVSLPSLDPYRVFGGNLLACVLRIGVEDSALEFLRIGSIPPEAVLTGTPSAGLIPLSVSFDASGSTDSDSTIAEFRWDADGDGSFETSTALDPFLEHEYSEAGEFQAAVRVIDSEGVYRDAAVSIHALSGLNFSYGSAVSDDKAVSLLRLPDGDLLVYGEQFEMNVARRVMLVRFDAGGAQKFAISCRMTGNDFPTDAQLAADGFIYTCGFCIGNTFDGFVQKWSQQGNLIWSKYLQAAGGGDVGLSALRVIGADIYVCGTYSEASSSYTRTLAARLNTDGQVLWARGIGEGNRDFGLSDIAVFLPAELGSVSVHCCGRYGPPSGNTDAFYVTYDTAGNLGFTDYWGTAEEYEYATSIVVNGHNNVSAVYIAGYELVGGRSFFSRHGGPSVYLSTAEGWLQSSGVQGFGGQFIQLLSLQSNGGDRRGGYIAGISTDALLQSVEFLVSSSSFQPRYYPYTISSYAGQGLLIGGSSTGTLPMAEAGSLTSTAGSLQWWDTGSGDFAIGLSSVESATELADPADFSFNRNAEDEDMHVLLLDR